MDLVCPVACQEGRRQIPCVEFWKVEIYFVVVSRLLWIGSGESYWLADWNYLRLRQPCSAGDVEAMNSTIDLHLRALFAPR
jgi:hypothetical protein